MNLFTLREHAAEHTLLKNLALTCRRLQTLTQPLLDREFENVTWEKCSLIMEDLVCDVDADGARGGRLASMQNWSIGKRMNGRPLGW